MIFLQLSQQLQTLNKLLGNLTPQQYTQKVTHLGNASIGGHTRHIIELLQCAIDGYATGKVDYVNRKRNVQLEENRIAAQSLLQQITNKIFFPDKHLMLVVEEIENAIQSTNVTTTYYREIVYNTEHTIHHLALIKVAIIEMGLTITDDTFGMAYSTIKYQAALANC